MLKKKAVSKTDRKSWICAVLLLVSTYPMWFWRVDYIVVPFATIVLFLFAISDLTRSKYRMVSIIAFALQLMILAINSNVFSKNISGVVFYLIGAIGFIPIFFSTPDFWRKIFDCFIKLLGVLLAMALVEHLLFAFGGVHLVSVSNSECQANPGRMYDTYLFNVYLQHTIGKFGTFNRFYAFFNEPGELGTFMVALLFIQRFDLKKWYNIVFLVSGLLSFSMAFYIALMAWYVFFGNVKRKVVFIIIAFAVFTYLYNNEIIYELVFSRLELEEDIITHRENAAFNNWVSSVRLEDYLFHPYQNRATLEYATTWKWAFIFYGAVPCVLYLLALVFSRIRKDHSLKDIGIGIALVAIIFVQRPFISSFFYVLMMVSPFLYFSSKTVFDKRQMNNNTNRGQLSKNV
ncbi:MAG: hypothetical protein IKN08_07670 [Bacteroidales bacterium]|nr:hypothetical protein [Bacteroidales bacterium]MBR6929724.1 hypothetical protein [Bacteroidales bacterium]